MKSTSAPLRAAHVTISTYNQGIPKLNFQEIEYAGFRSWPALEELELDGVVLRSSNGYTKRANSANLVSHYIGNFSSLVHRCENYFRSQNLPSIFRIPSYTNNMFLDKFLEELGYKLLDRSLVLFRSLDDLPFSHAEFQIKSSTEWIESFCCINESDISLHQAHLDIINRIEDQLLMAVLVENDIEIACGVGVISNGYFGLFDFATRENYRNMGYGSKLLRNMLSWAKSNGATKAYLQVVAENQPAVNLYKKLGYQECYEYWYRVKAV